MEKACKALMAPLLVFEKHYHRKRWLLQRQKFWPIRFRDYKTLLEKLKYVLVEFARLHQDQREFEKILNAKIAFFLYKIRICNKKREGVSFNISKSDSPVNQRRPAVRVKSDITA